MLEKHLVPEILTAKMSRAICNNLGNDKDLNPGSFFGGFGVEGKRKRLASIFAIFL